MKKVNQSDVKKEIKVWEIRTFKPMPIKKVKPGETPAPPNTPAIPVRTIKK